MEKCEETTEASSIPRLQRLSWIVRDLYKRRRIFSKNESCEFFRLHNSSFSVQFHNNGKRAICMMNLPRPPSDHDFDNDPRKSIPSWIESVEKPSIDDVPIEVRSEGERFLVGETMNVVQKVKNSIVDQIAGGNRNEVLTWHEQDVFSRYTYYGFKYGIPAGIATFAVLFGGLRYAAYRSFLKEINLPNAPDYHARVSARRSQYQFFDRPQQVNQTKNAASKLDINHASETAAISKTSSASFSPTIALTARKSNSFTFAIFPDDAFVSVQLYVTAAIGIFVSVMTWHHMYDWPKLRKDVSKLPLQPGSSILCHALCKNLINFRSSILQNEISVPSVSGGEASSPASSFDSMTSANQPKLKLVQLQVKDLWEDPITEDLELMVQLVNNCDQRMQYERECEQRQTRMVQPIERIPVWVVDVPEPGLPMRYYKLRSSDSSSDAP